MTQKFRLAFALLAGLVSGGLVSGGLVFSGAQTASAQTDSFGAAHPAKPIGEKDRDRVSSAVATGTEPRIALVIGNANYTGETRLANAANDAELIAATLKKLGFDVTLITDAEQKKMQRAIVDFGDKLVKAGPEATGLFYYAGHGVQVEGENYLIPVDANIDREADVDIDAVGASLVMKQMAFANSRVNIVILDACRDNPMAGAYRSIAGAQGFAEFRAKPQGTFIGYSTAPGEVAADGSDGHSPFASALAETMTLPGLDIAEVFQQVREKVLDATDQKQTPWDSSSLVKSFYFVPQAARNEAIAGNAPAAESKPQVVAGAVTEIAAESGAPLLRLASLEAPAGTARGTSGEALNAAEPEMPVFTAASRDVYAKSGARMRAEPSTAAAVIAKLPVNMALHAIGRSIDGAWWRVATADGGTGYVHRQAVSDFRTALQPAAWQPALAAQTATARRGGTTGIGLVDKAIGWIADTANSGTRPTAQTTRGRQ